MQNRTKDDRQIYFGKNVYESILIDEKGITTKGVSAMKHLRMRNISKIEGTQLGKEADGKVKEGERLDELGRDYLRDKEKFERQYENIANDPTLDRTHKKEQLQALRRAVEKLQEDYDKNVTENQEKVQEELNGLIETMQEAEKALDAQIDSLQNVQMDVAATDTSAAAEAAEAEKRKFREMHAKNVEELNLRIEQQQMQRREILRNSLSRR